MTNNDELRLWTVEVHSDGRAGPSPARPSFHSKTHVVNVAAPNIKAAIDGALDELRERKGDEYRDTFTVIAATHKGRVNRIVSEA